MASLKKSEALLRDLKEKLQLRLPSTYVYSQTVDSDGFSVLAIQQDLSWATTEQKAVIRIKAEPALGTDALGMPAIAYSPHVCQVASETSAVAGVSVLTDANQVILMYEISKMGCAVEWYLETAASEPVVGSMVAAKLIKRLDDLRFPLAGV